jgi:hypothetical protein
MYAHNKPGFIEGFGDPNCGISYVGVENIHTIILSGPSETAKRAYLNQPHSFKSFDAVIL